MSPKDLPWRIEEACFKAWPALKQTERDGWLVRFGEGLTRRANSANALPRATSGETLIEAVEEHYRAVGQPAIFRIVSFTDPAMRTALEKRGYTVEGESLVLSAAIHDVLSEPDASVEIALEPKKSWFAAMAKLENHPADKQKTYRKIVKSIASPVAYAVVRHKRKAVAAGYGVIHDRLLVFESVVTDEEERRQGHAKRMLATLVAWARAQGAEAVCLQVQADNEAAIALYKGLGLKEVYRYHYRRQPAQN